MRTGEVTRGMTDDPLRAEGREKAIYLAALRTYSDNCQAPALTPSCPYYVMTDSGPACGEECRDLLATHRSAPPDEPRVIVNLPGGLEAYRAPRPRPRRQPDATTRPFDATAIRRNDEERPRDQRQTTSLIIELREHLITPPWIYPAPDERAYVIKECRDQLASRGVDVEGLIRYGIAPMIAGSFGISLMIAEKLSGVDVDPAWVRCLDEEITGDDTERDLETRFQTAMTGSFRTRIRSWAASAPLDEIENWTAPGTTPDPLPDPDRERVDHAWWLLDRFTETYLDDWYTTSLHMEWRYQFSQRLGPCESSAMSERRIAVDDLSRAIAERATTAWEHGDTPAIGATPADFTALAVENLEAGRSDVAAGIFEGFIRVDPTNADAHNNYGFCVLPTDPAKAYEHLRRAEGLRFSPQITNSANQVLALHRMGRTTEAIELAQTSLDAGHPQASSYLWRLHGTDLQLVSVTDVHAELQALLTRLIGGQQ